jgi:2,3-bisphosphoglycerate-independent phosphoglycerate mutase
MEVVPTGETCASEIETLAKRFRDFDFFYVHVKGTDSAGEDGDFDRKVRVLEEVDALVPKLTALAPDVLVVSGDHSTPAAMKGHSWHPVPTILASRLGYGADDGGFSERACARGTLGQFPATDLMPMALAHAGRLGKYGA